MQQPLIKVPFRTYWDILRSTIAKFTLGRKIRKCLLFKKIHHLKLKLVFFLVQCNNIIFLVNCHPPGWLYIPVRMRNSNYKKSHKFRRLPLCSILYFNLMQFSENRDKIIQLGLMLFQTC